MTTKPRATVEDLYEVEGKAELVNGELVQMSPTGDLPSRAAGAIFVRLRQYEASAKTGRAYTDNAGFLVRLPGRQSFSPDVAFYVGPRYGGGFSKVPLSSPSKSEARETTARDRRQG